MSGKQTTAAQPELISFNGGTSNFSMNYRNEPLYPRVNASGSAKAKNSSFAYASSVKRNLPGQQSPAYPPLTAGVRPNDPFTPILRTYANDDVQVRILVGAHQNPHNFTMHGVNWLFEPSNVNSGWRSTQTMGISEHYEYLFKVPAITHPKRPKAKRPKRPKAPPKSKPWTDHLYKTTAARQGQAAGNWGLMRAYKQTRRSLHRLPQNPTPQAAVGVCPADLLAATCTAGSSASEPNANGHRLRCYSVVAASVDELFPGKALVYNSKMDFQTPNALIYLLEEDYNNLQASEPVPGFDKAQGLAEPLVLRAAAGDCIKVQLTNNLNAQTVASLGGYASGQLPVAGQNTANKGLFAPSTVSADVGLHPQLVTRDVARSDGTNAGFNPVQTAAPGASVTYWWYAGNVDASAPANERHIPVEFGASNLIPADPLNHHQYGLFGALVIEPEGSSWTTDPNSRASATVRDSNGEQLFRDFVVIVQDDIALYLDTGNGLTQQNGNGAVNYRTERLMGSNPFGLTRTCADSANPTSCVFSVAAQCTTGNGGSTDCGLGPQIPIQTPMYCARTGHQARFRLLHPGGAVTNQVFELHGHPYLQAPYSTKATHCATPLTQTNLHASQTIGNDVVCPDGDLETPASVSEWKAARMGHGPANHYDVVIEQAGGANYESGDFLYRSYPALHLQSGIWGIFRVTAQEPSAVPARCPSFQQPASASG